MQHAAKCLSLYHMKRTFSIVLLALAALSCRQPIYTPRPTVPLVYSIVADTSGLSRIPLMASHDGASGAVAILGEPSDAVSLASYLASVDVADNIDGRSVRDSLPDFAGEELQVLLDYDNSPLSSFLPESPDSLREATVRAAMFSWDSTYVTSRMFRRISARKTRSKMLVLTSAFQTAFGSFDIDTLQELTGGKTLVINSVRVLLKEALEAGPDVAVWASAQTRDAGIFEGELEAMGARGKVSVIAPEDAMDPRTEFRRLLAQYREMGGKKLDALVLENYSAQTQMLRDEIAFIRHGSTLEDQDISAMLSPSFRILDPREVVARAVYSSLRENNLFSHRIAKPHVRYFQISENSAGEHFIEEVSEKYVQSIN